MGSLKKEQKIKMKLFFAIFVAAVHVGAEWIEPSHMTGLNYTDKNCGNDFICKIQEAELNCDEADAYFKASENNAIVKGVESWAIARECFEYSISDEARIQTCWCSDDNGLPVPEKTWNHGKLEPNYICGFCEVCDGSPSIHCPDSFPESSEDAESSEAAEACAEAQAHLDASDDFFERLGLMAECESACAEFEDETCETVDKEACAEAQAKLDASDEFFKRLGLMAECESACAEFEDETCGFLVNGISFALLALLAFLRN